MKRRWGLALALGLELSLLGVACDDSGDDVGDDESSDSDGGALAPCEEQPVLTYDTFGRGFLATYCDGCHGSAVTDERRQGAPVEVAFDTAEGAQMYADRILARTAPPDGSAPTMPAVGGVTEEDRERLVVWLTCWE